MALKTGILDRSNRQRMYHAERQFIVVLTLEWVIPNDKSVWREEWHVIKFDTNPTLTCTDKECYESKWPYHWCDRCCYRLKVHFIPLHVSEVERWGPKRKESRNNCLKKRRRRDFCFEFFRSCFIIARGTIAWKTIYFSLVTSKAPRVTHFLALHMLFFLRFLRFLFDLLSF